MLRLGIFVLVALGIITGIICMIGDGYERGVKDDPDCMRRDERFRGCSGCCDKTRDAREIADRDCASCRFWRGNLNR